MKHTFNGYVGDKEVLGEFGVKERNAERQSVVDFAKRMWQGKTLENLVKLGEGKMLRRVQEKPQTVSGF